MRATRRWTEKDLAHLDERAYGLLSVRAAPPTPSEEARYLQLEQRRATANKLEALFAQHLTWSGMRPAFEAHALFHPTRKWTFDFYARPLALAIEIHGGTHMQGKHVRGEGFHNDRTKINAALEMGIHVLEFTAAMLEDGTAIAQTERMLVARGWSRPT